MTLLHYVPLHALLLKGEPIIRHYPVAYTPSASLMQYFGTGKGRLFNSASFGVVLKEDERMFGKESRNGIPSVKLSTLPKCNKANCPLKPRWERHIAFFMPWLL